VGSRSFSAVGATLPSLALYVDLDDLRQTLEQHRAHLSEPLRRHLGSFHRRLAAIASTRNRVMHSRPLQSNDFPEVLDVATDLTAAASQWWPETSDTIHRIAEEPHFVFGLRLPARRDPSNVHHNLPIPDFDDTGFLGRSDHISRLSQQLISGPYPVLSLIGEGGIGKTSLAMKVAYDLVDDAMNPFEAIIWASSKTTALTPSDIVAIGQSLTTSLGVFKEVSSALGPKGTEDHVSQILDYLRTFKVLLVLDNIETILDSALRAFLDDLPMGSKILLTSRIGLGGPDKPTRLPPLTEGEAVQLLRGTAQAASLTHLVRTDNQILADYCRRMFFNPGFIKWFISAIQSGITPDEVLAQPDTFLQFCMDNVYVHLSLGARRVLSCMAVAPNFTSVPDLTFLTSLSALEVREALHELYTSCFVSMVAAPLGSPSSSTFEISEMSRLYVIKYHQPSKDELDVYRQNRARIVALQDKILAAKRDNPYALSTFTYRSRADLIPVKHLMEALRATDSDSALKLLYRAQEIAPDYFETKRVEAVLESRRGNLLGAKDAYEEAIALAPTHAPLRYWFGGFLCHNMGDVEGALEQWLESDRLDAQHPVIMLEVTRAKMYLRDFPGAWEMLERVKELPSSVQFERKRMDLTLQWWSRRAEFMLDVGRPLDALRDLQSLREFYESIASDLRDMRMLTPLRKSSRTLRRCEVALSGLPEAAQAAELRTWLDLACQIEE
jgi:LuxR family transcriptional regulator, glucitol operon activator